MRKVYDYIELKAPENEKQKLMNEIQPYLAKIFEDENNQDFSSLVD